jgi:hypothetical protein
MATELSVTEHCLLCGRELPRGGFSARVAGAFLSPLCEPCQNGCYRDPDTVVAEHPQLFARPEAKETYVPPLPSAPQSSPPLPSESPRVVTPPASYPSASSSTLQQVAVTDIHMPFWSMVVFMVKWSIAAIPAIIILFFLTLIAYALFGTLLLM